MMSGLPHISSLRTKQTACYFLELFSLGLTTAAIGPAIPHLAEQTGSQLKEISSMLVMASFGYLLGSLAGGRLIDRIKGHPVIIIGLVCMAISFSILPLSPELVLLAVLAFILGLSQSFIDVGSNLMIVWAHGSNVGSYMNGLHLSFGVGTLVSPLLLAASLNISGATLWGFIIVAVLSLPAAFWLIRLPSPEIAELKGETQKFTKRWLPMFILVMLFYFVYVGYEVGFGSWIYTYALEMGLSSEVTAAYLTSAFWATFTFGRLLGIPAARRFASQSIMLTGVIICIISLVMIWLFPGSSTVLWLASCLYGLGMATLFPTLLTLASQTMPLSGKLTSLFFASASFGGMFFPWLIGQLIDARGPESMIPIVFSLVLASFFILVGIIELIPKRI
ncbi:MAG: MFS transporter [Anaerolineaceae bacterium]|nr:MFS transporter [Anaerolineaceae bacterium]